MNAKQGGLTDTEREALWRATPMLRPRELDFVLIPVVEQIKAAAYQQGRDDLAAKVGALADEWESEGGAEPFAWNRLRAVLAADSTPRDGGVG